MQSNGTDRPNIFARLKNLLAREVQGPSRDQNDVDGVLIYKPYHVNV